MTASHPSPSQGVKASGPASLGSGGAMAASTTPSVQVGSPSSGSTGTGKASAKDTPKEGEIVATGKGILNKNSGEYMPFTVKTGDRVIFSSYAGTEIKIEQEEYMVMGEDEVLAIVN